MEGKEVIFKVTGQVCELEGKIGVPNLVVRAFDKDLIHDDLLGSVTTDENGCFEIICEGEEYRGGAFCR
jgi:carotenoid cleavage dioxygenase